MNNHSLPIDKNLVPRVSAEVKGAFLEWLHGWVVTVDHKRLGILYVLYSIFFLLVAGAEAILIRIQLAIPHNSLLSAEVYNRFFTMHGTTMVFLVGMPILFGFANYIVPLQIGARDMAFPRLNAFSFWLTAFGGLFCTSVSSEEPDCMAWGTHQTPGGSLTLR
jgi:cytochrome c oxidase subunit 1